MGEAYIIMGVLSGNDLYGPIIVFDNEEDANNYMHDLEAEKKYYHVYIDTVDFRRRY